MTKIETSYTIITDPHYLTEQRGISPVLLRKLERYHNMAIDGKKSSIQKILDAIEQYPDIPQLKNYLSVLYGQLNEIQKMYDVNKWVIAEHPHYLFGKLNLANEFYLKGEFSKMPDVLGSQMEIQALYPERDTFHIIEVLSFYKCAVRYFTGIGDIEQAQIRYEIMQKLAPDDSNTQEAKQDIYIASMKAAQKRFEEEQKLRISVNVKPQEYKDISQAPNFQHEQIEWLYCNGFYIDEEKINTILALPKDTLIKDLELVLQDSIDRYLYFQKLFDKNGWDEEKMNFVMHSLFLLGELNAAKSIDAIFNVLSQPNEYLEFYLGDFITEGMWEIVYKVAANNLEECKQFMFKPGVDTFARTIFPDMVEQIALHQLERKDEVKNWFNDVIQFFLDSTIEDNVIDSEVIALLICNVMHINNSEILPQITKLFERKLVSQGICGDLNAVTKAIKQSESTRNKRKILTIIERYKEVTTTWSGYTEKDNNWKSENERYLKSDFMTVKNETKIGRNEPCPCGSGKKYKKCCLN